MIIIRSRLRNKFIFVAYDRFWQGQSNAVLLLQFGKCSNICLLNIIMSLNVTERFVDNGNILIGISMVDLV